jgi:hypothetical protein
VKEQNDMTDREYPEEKYLGPIDYGTLEDEVLRRANEALECLGDCFLHVSPTGHAYFEPGAERYLAAFLRDYAAGRCKSQ